MTAFIAAPSFRDTTAEEWQKVFDRSRARDISTAGDHVLTLLRSQESVATSGWAINAYTHALQAGTKALRAGMDEEYVVCALLHDIGEFLDPFNHGDIAGEVVKNFVSPENYWMVANHPVFQLHFRDHSRYDREACLKYQGHPAFERTLDFCERFDQSCFDGAYDNLPLEAFEPMVRRVFMQGTERLYARHPYATRAAAAQ
ncbi:HD domain-containing protein [Limobrevibacterium gyesilva]|uniref:Phosphohydrolase n=1 Tax=Limobrevibacterium gyesilva TaxID=2991712 RepID=A0AA41YR87_9PROT|nr:HD domain-containing protein [Limobrevibacterium gyesilva]MCW3475030.1 phosphohydrolase [Limobrevibacterium gyesilva]